MATAPWRSRGASANGSARSCPSTASRLLSRWRRRPARRKGDAATDVVSTLRQLSDLADIRGAAAEAADLRRAAAAIEALGSTQAAHILKRARRDTLDEPGISPTIHWRFREIAEGGAEVALRAARAGVPLLIRRLLELPALSPADAALLVRQTGCVTLADLERELDDGGLRSLLGSAGEERLRRAATALLLEAPQLHLGRALDFVDALTAVLEKSGASVERISAAGDARRFESLVREIIVVAASPNPAAAIDTIAALPAFADVLHRTSRRAILQYQSIEVDLRVASPDEYGSVLFEATGSREHVKGIAARRRDQKCRAREEQVFEDAGLTFIPPELRHATGEIEAAAERRLPHLVDRSHIRGDLHMHSTYSDGRDTLEEMVRACAELGYEYIAITDHSERAGASRTVARNQLTKQRNAIAALREQYPQLAILHGLEVDIMPDGSLDFEDDLLAPLDIVLASLHDAARQGAGVLTRRCLQAIRHPLVNVITHPANRLVGRRAGYALDFPAIYRAAAETGTALEIDGAPSHLDLDGEHARAAAAAGVTLAIDSDCHRARALARNMQMGIGVARRGWIEPKHVLNTRPLAAVREFIAAKRHS